MTNSLSFDSYRLRVVAVVGRFTIPAEHEQATTREVVFSPIKRVESSKLETGFESLLCGRRRLFGAEKALAGRMYFKTIHQVGV